MRREFYISVPDLALCISGAVDLANPALVNHHKRVAFIAVNIARELGLSLGEQTDLLVAGLLHDIGALSLGDMLDLATLETADAYRHAELGYRLLSQWEPLSLIAPIVRYHHVPWANGHGVRFEGMPVPSGGHIINLADRVAVLLPGQSEVLGQVAEIRDRIIPRSGGLFVPDLVEVFRKISAKESFWLDATSATLGGILAGKWPSTATSLEMRDLICFAKLLCQVIDFRSPFTATHSAGVAASAEALARAAGLSGKECQIMVVAGYLHDLGKLAIPKEILEKPAKLTRDEISVIKSHTYYTYRTLETINDLDTINKWASLHHERLDGTGYPFKLKGDEIPLGSRIMAVADVFTAINEDRPYRKGMASEEAISVLEGMARDKLLDENIVALLRLRYGEVNSSRISAQEAAAGAFQEFGR